MPIFLRDQSTPFPAPDSCDDGGLIAMGGEITPDRLLDAYSRGIFPWPHQDLPLLWFCPDPRFVLWPASLRINKTLRRAIKNSVLEVAADRNFSAVIEYCRRVPRNGQPGTWITDELKTGYEHFHERGFAHSVEAYDGGRLVGGLYGIALGGTFFGESMFAHQSNTSKICFVTLVAHLIKWGVGLIDCQQETKTFADFGAKNIPRADFLSALKESLKFASPVSPWQFSMTPQESLEYLQQQSRSRFLHKN